LWTKDGNSGKYYHGGVKKTVIEGHWLFDGKRVTGDEACEQIDSLIPTLTFLASREGGWTRLFRDPDRTVTRVMDGGRWFKWQTQCYFYDDSNPPGRNRQTRERLIAILARWGIEVPS